jgi:hypothetical protein
MTARQAASVAFLAGRQLWLLNVLQPGHRHVGHCVCRPAEHNTSSIMAFCSRPIARMCLEFRVNAMLSLFGQAVHADLKSPEIDKAEHYSPGQWPREVQGSAAQIRCDRVRDEDRGHQRRALRRFQHFQVVHRPPVYEGPEEARAQREPWRADLRRACSTSTRISVQSVV